MLRIFTKEDVKKNSADDTKYYIIYESANEIRNLKNKSYIIVKIITKIYKQELNKLISFSKLHRKIKIRCSIYDEKL